MWLPWFLLRPLLPVQWQRAELVTAEVLHNLRGQKRNCLDQECAACTHAFAELDLDPTGLNSGSKQLKLT